MTTTEALLAFTVAAGLLTVTPGLDTALVLRTAAVEGPRRALAAGLGICCGCLGWGIVVALGLGALLAASELAYAVLRWAGAAYLIYLGTRMVLSSRGAADESLAVAPTVVPATASSRRWLARGFATNMLNPKVGVFYVTFLPQFVPPGAGVTGFTVLLATVHAVEGMLWFGLLVAATRPLAAALRRMAVVRTLDRLTGSVLIAFGLRLAFEERR